MDAAALAALELPAIVDRLATFASTDYGVALARELAPSPDPATVGRRHELTSAAVSVLAGDAAPELAGIRDVRSSAERSGRGGLLRPDELRAIAVSVRVALEAKRVLREPILSVLLEPVDPGLGGLADEIDRRIEEDGSDVRDTASPLLRKLRTELRNGTARVRDELARVARSSDVQDALQESFLVERGGRPVLAVRASSRSKVPGVVHDASSTGQTLFVEPFAVVELNNRLAEAAADAREEVERILGSLVRFRRSARGCAVRTRRGDRRARPGARGRRPVAVLGRGAGRDRRRRAARRRPASAPRRQDRRSDRRRPRHGPRARDQRARTPAARPSR